jgi:cytoskeleton protein RodZ
MNHQQELIPMTTGEYLKQKRADRKLSLAAVARAIGLDETLLRDIENEKASRIAPVYRNGYIQTYARFLKIPEEEISAMVSSGDVTETPLHSIFPEAQNRNPADKWLRASSYVLASLLIGTLAWQFTHEAVRLSQNGSGLSTRQEVVSEPESDGVPENVTKFKGPVNASIAQLGTLHNKDTTDLDTAEQAWAAMSNPALADGESRLALSVSADSWIEITDANGQELEMDLLRGGSDKSYHGKPPFRFLFGRASAVRLYIDGELVDLAEFTQDDVAQLSWPQQLQAGEAGQDRN